MNEITSTYSSYIQFKQALDTEMLRTAEGFVRIGYLLKYAEETNIVNEGGYNTVNEFAKAEYGIDTSQVSRFVNIYERFGVPGEPRLKEQYASHGVAKLGIMLTLPDEINEEISDTYSKSEIKQLQEEIKAEQQISDIEVMLEEKDEVQQSLPEGLKRMVHQLIHDYPKEYGYMYKCYSPEELVEALAPNGECAYNIRIPGTGRLIVFVKPENIVATNVRSGEKESYEWQQFFDAVQEYVAMGHSVQESWENVFNENYPKEEMPQKAPGTKAENTTKSESKKESKVKTPAKPKPVEIPTAEPVKEPEEQLPGQDNIMNHPEYLPEGMKEEVLTGEVENIENADKHNVEQDSNVQQADFKVEHIAPVQNSGTDMREAWKRGVKNALEHMQELFEEEKWDMLSGEATALVWQIKKLKELEGKN